LKRYLCGQDVPLPSPTQNADDIQKGTILSIRSRFPISGYNDFFSRISAFNRAVMPSGLQAVPQEPSASELVRFIVCECPTETIGDLLVSMVPGPFDRPPEGLGGVYLMGLHQAFVFTGLQSDVAHECEHGAHYSIWRMTGFPVRMRRVEAEYLSTLLELIHFDDQMVLLRGILSKCKSIRGMNPKAKPHLEASFRFIHRLKGRYGMSEDEILRGMAYMEKPTETDIYLAEACGVKIIDDSADAVHREKLMQHAEEEYERTYERVFGLPLKAIKEIISGIAL